MKIFKYKAALLYMVLPFLFVLHGTYTHAGTISGQMVTAAGKLPETIILRTYLNAAKGDTIQIGTFGDFKVQVPYAFPVSCVLNVGRSYYSFMYNPAETSARINLITEDGVLKQGAIENSNENKAYGEIEKLMQEFDKMMFYHVKDNSPSLSNYIEEYNSALNQFQYTYKGTYSADVLAQMRKIKVDKKIPAIENLRRDFFANVNFADSSVIANALLGNLVDFYSRYICDTTPKARLAFYTDIMERSKANGFVYRKLAQELYSSAYERKDDDIMQAYLAWFAAKADTVALPVLNVKQKMLRRVMPGQPAIDVTIVENGKTLASLKQTAAQYKYTLLMIWESHCSHCREAIPTVKELYSTHHDKGFQVFGVSLDNEQKEWEAYIKEQDIQWLNIMAKQSTSPIENYYIQSTPSFVLIDNKGNIVHRLLDIKGIKAYLKENMK